jgi:hypothetical protein
VNYKQFFRDYEFEDESEEDDEYDLKISFLATTIFSINQLITKVKK